MLILPLKAFAVFEFDFDFGYDKQIFGANRQNSVVTRNYSVGLSSYLFDLTAIDLNFSNTKDTTTQNERSRITGYNVDRISQQSRVSTNVFGLGIKQMLAGRGSWIIPVISVGYAREFITSGGDTTYEDVTSHAQLVIPAQLSKQRYNSVFGSFTLQLKLTDRFSLKGSVKTLFPAFEFNQARDNIKYLFGFAWIF
ncbi:MAG: hypothetical protein Q7U04_08235 [Bacteriovorax sp.]|nr:hypothetical protein [Bacteriovorax sp.]